MAKSKTAEKKPAPLDTAVVTTADGPLPANAEVDTDDGTLTTATDPRADVWPQLNAFVSVTGGEHQGKYGVADGVDHDGNVIVVTRDDNHERIVVAYTDLARDRSGRR